MSKKLTYTFILLARMLLCNQLRAQVTPDSVLTAPERSAVSLYNKTVGDRLGIYRGPARPPYALRSLTNPNFRDTTDYFENGVVNYDNRIYYHVPIIYNIERNKLESRIDITTPYELLNDRVTSFDLPGHHFIRFVPDADNKLMTIGFYDVRYHGKIQVLARYIKTAQHEIRGQTSINVFYPKTDYFIKKGSVYYSVNSRGRFLDALADKKKELQQYIKDNKIDFSQNMERSMVIMAEYYDHLTN
jgi:hypothetical protein